MNLDNRYHRFINLYVHQKCIKNNIDEFMEDYIMLETESLFLEKSEWKELRDNWKRKYNYVQNPDDPNEGTITDNGKKIIIRWDNPSSGKYPDEYNALLNLNSHYVKTDRATGNKIINMPRDVFRIYNKNTSNILNDHEVGHDFLGNTDEDRNDDGSTTTAITRKNTSSQGGYGTSSDRVDDIKARKQSDKTSVAKTNRELASDASLKYSAKPDSHRSKSSISSKHPDSREFESDAFAADRAEHGASDVNKAIKDMYYKRNILIDRSNKRDIERARKFIHSVLSNDDRAIAIKRQKGYTTKDLAKIAKQKLNDAIKIRDGKNPSFENYKKRIKKESDDDAKQRIRALQNIRRAGIDTKSFTD